VRTRLIVCSLDAMVGEDVAYLKTLPNFRRYFGNQYSEVRTIRSVYPTITYPVHASIVTGCYPDKHGITNNQPFHTESGEYPWYWFQKDIKRTDIFQVAHDAGYKTGAVFWPVTGCHPAIDDLIDEYWIQPGETLEGGFGRTGSDERMCRILRKNSYLLPAGWEHGGRKAFVQQPYLDDFITACTCDVLRDGAEVVFLHGGSVDGARHQSGMFSPLVTEYVQRCDQWIGQIMQTLAEIGHLEDTNIVLLSDHGQMNIVRAVNINALLRERGFIDVDEKTGVVRDWRAWNLSNAFSSLVYVKDKRDEPVVGELLYQLRDEGVYGIGQVFTAREAEETYHLAGPFSFVLESDGYSSLASGIHRPLVVPLDNSDFRLGRATHGYLPDKGPQPFFLAKGPAFKSGVTLARRPIVDEAPTFAKVLGLAMPEDIDGICMDELLE